MALEFTLTDGALQLMTVLSTPKFVAIEPKTSLDLMIASKPDAATGKPAPK